MHLLDAQPYASMNLMQYVKLTLTLKIKKIIKFQEILGHTEDALSENLNNYYIVSAHIISDDPQGKYKVKEERFTSLCYAGHLPGYTMNYNHHGLV